MTAGRHYRLVLSPEPRSAGLARKVLRDLAAECALQDLLDGAELALSELVTNVVLHAHTDIELTLTCTPEQLRVEVRDGSSQLVPEPRRGPSGGAPAEEDVDVVTTGRGMDLVAAVTDAHGVVTHGEGGKTVWFAMSRHGQLSSEEPLPWDLDSGADDGADAEVSVTLLGFPPTLWQAAALQHDAVLRELALLDDGHPARPSAEAFAASDRARVAVRSALAHALAAARESGAVTSPLPAGHPARLEAVPATVDLVLHLARDASADFASLQDVLDAAQRLATDGRMLAAPALPEVIAVRDWAAEQVITLLAGEAGRPWPGADAEEFTRRVDVEPAPEGYEQLVAGTDRAILVDSHNRITAITPVLAEELGWRHDDLVGRRVVCLIPPRFRESHTAGFTRHLTTGEARALDVDLELPVLHFCGDELSYGFRISAVRTHDGRGLYRAVLTTPGSDPG